ncbi:zinc finger CCCH domain-containing protein 18-like [Solanum dulcamara]|uniref:zinc finger CCCH domain-containing protein 18-like n=1 Tax=Solanum dulcamara TaxID=45834 RepID=UPI002484F8EB|nr:zinc finger CCCH domain-containing protein 18-like [Solanum dulcamara]XP_055824211.1 zinc finger CCCH domain-containing protein 18-like [Solanum dulcamara]
MSMDFSEFTEVVYNRIQKLEPEHVSKIIGYVLLYVRGKQDMIRLAFSPDNLIHSLINRVKNDLGLSPKPAIAGPLSPPLFNRALSDIPLKFGLFSPASPRPFTNHRVGNPYWEPQRPAENRPIHTLDFLPDPVTDERQLQNQLQFLSLDDHSDHVNSDFSGDHYFPGPTLGPRSSRRSSSLPEFPVKICHYFNKGFCKHGNNCRYIHGHPTPESFSQVFNANLNEVVTDEHVFSPGSLEKLEMELTELLKSKGGVPVSIASLPMLYYDTFGRTLQAEGYLTESQRHGKAGYSLTKLLARLRNSIRVIDRPHGQHAVILAEDIPKYMEYNGERNEHGAIVAGSRQIYLTFPAESTFSEQDVSNYFSQFGPVQDVRIPCQQKRMFGFVTFGFSETVKQILAKGNPHLVCGARVLVKPYREKSKIVDRKCLEKAYQGSCYNPFADAESEHQSSPRVCENSRLLKKHLMGEHERAIEFEKRCFPDMPHHQMRVGYSVEDLKLSSEGHSEQLEFPSAEGFSYMLDVWNNGSTSNNKTRHVKTNHYDQESGQGLNLPDSPFASPIRNSISSVT